MTKEKKIKQKIEKLLKELGDIFGSTDGIAILEGAFPAGVPDKPNAWVAKAARLQGDKLQFGWVLWDFGDDDREDQSAYDWSVYDWSFTADDFSLCEESALNDTFDIEWALADLMANARVAGIDSL